MENHTATLVSKSLRVTEPLGRPPAHAPLCGAPVRSAPPGCVSAARRTVPSLRPPPDPTAALHALLSFLQATLSSRWRPLLCGLPRCAQSGRPSAPHRAARMTPWGRARPSPGQLAARPRRPRHLLVRSPRIPSHPPSSSASMVTSRKTATPPGNANPPGNTNPPVHCPSPEPLSSLGGPGLLRGRHHPLVTLPPPPQ